MDCKYCKKTNKSDDFVYETKHWRVFLAFEQSYLGRCVVAAKRHCGSLPELTREGWSDFIELVKKFEAGLRKAFGATMFNWACLMNNAYQKDHPSPHTHWHFRPRYKDKVRFAGQVFEDPEFGYHYDKTRTQMVSDEVKRQIINKIRENL